VGSVNQAEKNEAKTALAFYGLIATAVFIPVTVGVGLYDGYTHGGSVRAAILPDLLLGSTVVAQGLVDSILAETYLSQYMPQQSHHVINGLVGLAASSLGAAEAYLGYSIGYFLGSGASR
jgi:hypothetical protein